MLGRLRGLAPAARASRGPGLCGWTGSHAGGLLRSARPRRAREAQTLCKKSSMLLAIYFAVGALAATCKTDGDHAATCASGKCEVIGSTEVCTQCKAGGVPIDGFCRPSTSPQAITAGCTVDASAGVCKACSGEFFLFMGGCYDARAAPGSGVCREARDGACVGYKEEVSKQRVFFWLSRG